METIVDKIIDKISSVANEQYNDFTKKAILSLVDEIKEIDDNADFDEVALLMIKHINKYHPHHCIIVDATHAELLEGERSTGIIVQYLRD